VVGCVLKRLRTDDPAAQGASLRLAVWTLSKSAPKTLAMVRATFQSGLTANLTLIAIASAARCLQSGSWCCSSCGAFSESNVDGLLLEGTRPSDHVHPTVHQLTKNDLTITFTCLGQKKPEIVLALGTEARTLRFEELIDFWQDMIEWAPNAADTHLAYIEESTRQGIERKVQ
jgi:hypothetical protein